MDRQETLIRVKKALGHVLHMDPHNIFDGAHFARDLNLDAMQGALLADALEKEFKIRIDEERIFALKSIAAVADHIADILSHQ